jgi:hypothetical protein
MVRGEMPRMAAARDVQPPVYSSVDRMACRSITARVDPGTGGLVSAVDPACGRTVGGRSVGRISPSRHTTTARSTAFSSSRTLPGHG